MPKGLPRQEAAGVEVLMIFGKRRSLERVGQRFKPEAAHLAALCLPYAGSKGDVVPRRGHILLLWL